MASQSLKNTIQGYENYIVANGVDEDVINAYVMAAGIAISDEKDKEYGLQLTARAKELINQLVYNLTGGDIWELEKYAQDFDLSYSLVDTFYELLKLESWDKLESFIFYMEKKRKQNRRFYQPRQETLHIVTDDLEDLEARIIEFYGLSMPSRVGKLISDETPVLTTKGWKNHGDLVVGDMVFDQKGNPTPVTYVFQKNVANKRVWFSDETYIDCHENHEWLVYDRSTNKERIVETKKLKNSEYKENGNKRYKYFLPNVDAIYGEEKELPVKPYTFGAWLGDGTVKKPRITICDTDNEILEAIEKEGYKCIHAYKQEGCTGFEFAKLKKDLQSIELCHSRQKKEKYIPEIYFCASLEQRLELLAGLLDTDGSLRRDENRYCYTTVSKRIKDDFVKLVSTFGWRCSVVEYEPKMSSSGIQAKNVLYAIGFNPTMNIPCKVPRKQIFKFSKKRRISITKVEDIKPKAGNCISVKGGIYRVGERCKPTHNSTMCIFFLGWVALKRPNSHNAMGGHSGILAKGFYKELLNLISTEEYTFAELFEFWHPGRTVLRDKSADEFTITLDNPDRFATITCRGIDGTWTGAVDVSADGYLYVDDLVRDRQHSLSPVRMEDTYQEYLNKMVDRKNDGARELMVGTLWNVLDPLERIRKQYEGNPKYRFRKIPALNDDDESNFDYKINGFSTNYYRNMREKLDKAEWEAKFQQRPFVREGLLLPLDELRYFNGILPEGDFRRVAVTDIAWGGGDSLSMPIGAEYENGDVYIYDWVFNNGPKEVTIPLVTGKIIENEIRQTRFEGNNGGDLYCQYVDEELQKHNYKCSCDSQKAPNKVKKLEKIIAYAGDIKRKFVFLTSKLPTSEQREEDARLGIKRYYRSKEYQKAMDELGMFVSIGKNEHDDAADSLTQLEMFIENPRNSAVVEAVRNPFRGGYEYGI